MLTPYVHAGKQSYVVKAGLHTFYPTGRAYRVVVPDFTLPIPMMLCIWLGLSFAASSSVVCCFVVLGNKTFKESQLLKSV